jgi:hypothetical protein
MSRLLILAGCSVAATLGTLAVDDSAQQEGLHPSKTLRSSGGVHVVPRPLLGRSKSAMHPGISPTRLELVHLALSLSDEMDYELMTEAAERFAATNPRAGIVAAHRLKDGPRQQAFLETLFRRWALRDGHDAAEYWVGAKASELGEGPRKRMMLATASGWSETDPTSAAAWLDEYGQAAPIHSSPAISLQNRSN